MVTIRPDQNARHSLRTSVVIRNLVLIVLSDCDYLLVNLKSCGEECSGRGESSGASPDENDGDDHAGLTCLGCQGSGVRTSIQR